ncbi:MAG: CAF17-like 4Fe-4S cluster assembly/insertion protein YgfZ [Gammaproteobacteria bacterium]
MNPLWKIFLLTQQAGIEEDGGIIFPSAHPANPNRICPAAHLAVLTVSGNDAAKFLQGQITCNVFDVTESQSRIGAICNPKGRAAATFVLVKTPDAFLLVLPSDLLQSMKERLQKFVLRSDVKIADRRDDYCLIGISQADTDGQGEGLFATRQQGVISIKFSAVENRRLVIADPEKAVEFWTAKVEREIFQPENSERWRLGDMLAGIPWLSPETAEEFIPQMLNLDKLGGISFSKGCYTGQEIVARTHYLGKAKREMFLAEAATAAAPLPNSPILDRNADGRAPVGSVLTAFLEDSVCTMLVILHSADIDRYDLILPGPDQDKVTLLIKGPF